MLYEMSSLKIIFLEVELLCKKNGITIIAMLLVQRVEESELL
nr:MAG TPA: hypothetical protein [Caudoviricetes sp.]